MNSVSMAKTSSLARIQHMNVTEWKDRGNDFALGCVLNVQITYRMPVFETNHLNTTVHNMFPCQVDSSRICMVHSPITGDFCVREWCFNKTIRPNLRPWAQSDWTFNPVYQDFWRAVAMVAMGDGSLFPKKKSTPSSLGLLGNQTVWNCTAGFPSAEPQITNIGSKEHFWEEPSSGIFCTKVMTLAELWRMLCPIWQRWLDAHKAHLQRSFFKQFDGNIAEKTAEYAQNDC